MNKLNLKTAALSLMAILTITITSCSNDDEGGSTPVEPEASKEYTYIVGVESATTDETDILSQTNSVESGTISPVGNGFEQPAWMVFFQGVDQIFAAGYTSAPEIVSYSVENGELVKGDSFFTDLGIYARDVVDEGNMVLIGSPRKGLGNKKIYRVNTNAMAITKTVETKFGNEPTDSLLAFPTDALVRDGKLFASYYLTHARGDFSTPKANEAKIAVFSYPGLEFEKIIMDDRAPNVGRYYTTNAMQEDEKGDIYTFSPSALSCGFAPTPKTNSGVLRIKKGSTDFDKSYHIDFETLSGGYKLNDLLYVADGKAVVRVVKEDETNPKFLWATYAPTGETPLIETGILDLYNKTFKLLPEVPKAGGGWNTAHLVQGKKLYLGASAKTFADIYVIDVEKGTATKGAKIDGNYAKAILALEK